MTERSAEASQLWQYWFDLKTAARDRDWARLDRLLVQAPERPLAAHPFVAETFHAAANHGQTDIVRTLFSRGFAPGAETLAETVSRLAEHHHETAGGVIAFLVRERMADASNAVCHAAAQGRLDVLQTLAAAGADVLCGASGFYLALYGGHPAVMHYLHEKGADLYHPAVIAAAYGRQGDLPPGRAETTIAAYRALLDNDARHWAECYAESGGAQKTLAQFRLVPNGLGRAPMNRLQLAARAGKFSDVAAAAAVEADSPLTAADILMTDFKGVSTLAVLAARGELDLLFDPRLWHRRPGEPAKLREALRAFRAEEALDIPSLSAEMDRHRLRLQRPGGLRLRLDPGSPS